MAGLSRTGSKAITVKARKAKGTKKAKATESDKSKSANTKRRIAPVAKPPKHHSIADLTKELKQAREQQAATAEILKVINSSPNDLTSVFDIILEKAHRLCDITTGSLELYEGDIARSVAARGMNVRWEQYLRQGYKITETLRPAYMAVGHSHVIDMKKTVERFPDEPTLRAFVEVGGLRTFLALPLVKDGIVFGRIVAARAEVQPFTEKQISLLQSFADQAVVAIENARLFSEQRELLEQQTATAEILKVINSSPGDLTPVFDIILQKAHSLCDVTIGSLELRDGDFIRTVASRGFNDQWERWLRGGYKVSELAKPDYLAAQHTHIVDMKKLVERFPDEPAMRAFVEVGGLRTFLDLKLVKDGVVFGRIIAARDEVRPFTDKQIALLQSFADQAVIAIENARLLTEQREALERQTATSEVLQVISSSVSDTLPVFEKILDSCQNLIACTDLAVLTIESDDLVHLGSTRGSNGLVAAKNFRPSPVDKTIIAQAVAELRTIHIPDSLHGEIVSDVLRRVARRVGQSFSCLIAPMKWQGSGVGALFISRVFGTPFTQNEISLFETFADQAVIAIQNARLFNETKEALERQTATADILRVISGSPTDVQPVFQAIAEHARLLCKAQVGATSRLDGDMVHLAGVRSMSADAEEAMRSSFPMPLKLASPNIRRAIVEQVPIQIPDVHLDSDYADLVDGTHRMGFRSIMSVPLIHEGRSIGTIGVAREEPGLFPLAAVSLLQTFADQAVIAIENVRLYNETREALEQQKASADILSVISSSVADAQPVFEKILMSCKHLFGGDELDVLLVDGQGHLSIAAYIGDSHDVVAATFPAPVERTPAGRAIRERRVMHWPDLVDGEDVPGVLRKMAKLIGYRSMVFAPMLWEGCGIGAIGVARSTGPFKPKELAIIQTFADQAVIAIQNARLFNETREALERQTATADILKVIASSPSDVQPIFDAIAERSKRLVDALSTTVFRLENGVMHLRAFTPTNPEADATLKAMFPAPLSGFSWSKAIGNGEIYRVLDTDLEVENLRELARLRGFRSMLFVPLLRDRKSIGVIAVTRVEPGPFVEHHVRLLQTFADQAVIAIENVRLFDDVQAKTNDLTEALQQQTATADVLKVISRSAFDLQTVLDTLTESAARLCNADMAAIVRQHPDGNGYYHATNYNFSTDWLEITKSMRLHPGRGSVVGRALLESNAVQVADVLQDSEYAYSEMQKAAGYRTLFGVPLLRAGQPIGVLFLGRRAVDPFSDKQIELVRTFADQAVIAIENVRLFDEVQAKTQELQESLEYQTATSDVLNVISRSPSDIQPVLDTIVETAGRLCEAYDTIIFLREDETLKVVAHRGSISLDFDRLPISHGTVSGRAVLEMHSVHVRDVTESQEFPDGKAMGSRLGYRTILATPLLREDVAIGAVIVRRAEVRPFSEEQISLLQTFADQAVIAIGNVRLFEQVRERTRELSHSLDELRTTQDRLVQTEKLASLGQLTAGIAHEIKNPLNFVNNFSALSVELIEELGDALKLVKTDDKNRKEIEELAQMLKSNVEKIEQHGKRADSIVKNMLLHSRDSSGEHRPIDINTIVEESLNLAYHGARAEKSGFNITLKCDLDSNAGLVDLYPQEITRVFLNLVTNGFYAATKRKEATGPEFEPVLSVSTKDLGDSVEIRIRDNGTGISDDVKEKMFNPFFTTKPAGEGTGLGLSMSHDIVVKQHGGKIEVETQPDSFTEFLIVLPRSAAGQENRRSRA